MTDPHGTAPASADAKWVLRITIEAVDGAITATAHDALGVWNTSAQAFVETIDQSSGGTLVSDMGSNYTEGAFAFENGVLGKIRWSPTYGGWPVRTLIEYDADMTSPVAEPSLPAWNWPWYHVTGANTFLVAYVPWKQEFGDSSPVYIDKYITQGKTYGGNWDNYTGVKAEASGLRKIQIEYLTVSGSMYYRVYVGGTYLASSTLTSQASMISVAIGGAHGEHSTHGKMVASNVKIYQDITPGQFSKIAVSDASPSSGATITLTPSVDAAGIAAGFNYAGHQIGGETYNDERALYFSKTMPVLTGEPSSDLGVGAQLNTGDRDGRVLIQYGPIRYTISNTNKAEDSGYYWYAINDYAEGRLKIWPMEAVLVGPTLTVTFDPMGGSTPDPATKEVILGSTYGTLPTVTREGFVFAGWYPSLGCGVIEVTSATTVVETEAHTLYAHWKLAEKAWPQPDPERWRSGIPEDTDRLLVFDLSNGAIYAGANIPIASTTQIASPAPAVGEHAAMTYVGGSDGYLYQGFVEQSASLGMPSRRARFECCINAVPNKLVIDSVAMEAIFPTDGKTSPGSGIPGLPVLVCLAQTDGTFTEEWGVVSTNDTEAITLVDDLTEAATVGDHFYVAPMYCGVLFEEERTSRPACLRALEMNILDGQMAEQRMTAMVYCPEGPGVTVSLDGDPEVERIFTTEDLQRGRGVISMPARSARARVYGLGFRPSGGGTLQIENINAAEFVHPSEADA